MFGRTFSGIIYVALFLGGIGALVLPLFQPGEPQRIADTADQPAARRLDDMLAEMKALAVEELAGPGWARACLSRGAQPRPASMVGCWPAPVETALGGSFVNVLDSAGQCQQWRSVKPVIDPRFDDAICLSREEVPALTLTLRGNLVDIE